MYFNTCLKYNVCDIFQKISTWQQKSEENINEDNLTKRKSSLALIKAMTSFDRQKSVKSNKSEDSEDDDDDDDNRDNEGRIRIQSGQEV